MEPMESQQLVKEESPPLDHETNDFIVTPQSSNKKNSADSKKFGPGSTGRYQMEFDSTNVQRTADQKLSNVETELNAKQDIVVKKEVKEEILDVDKLSTLVQPSDKTVCSSEDNELDTIRLHPNNSEVTGGAVDSPEMSGHGSDQHELIETPINLLPTYNGHSCKKDFNIESKLDAHMAVHRLDENDENSLAESEAIGFTNSTVDEESLNDTTTPNVEGNSSHERSSFDLDSNSEDDQNDSTDTEGRRKRQCLLRKDEEQSGTLYVRNKEQSSKPDEFNCLDCPTVCKTKFEFREHTSTHDGYRRHQCAFCEKRFKRNVDLRRHEQIHKAVKQFKCSICGKYFVRKGDYIVHQRKHTEPVLPEEIIIEDVTSIDESDEDLCNGSCTGESPPSVETETTLDDTEEDEDYNQWKEKMNVTYWDEMIDQETVYFDVNQPWFLREVAERKNYIEWSEDEFDLDVLFN